MLSLKDLLEQTSQKLSSLYTDSDTARNQSWHLIEALTGKTRVQLLVHNEPITETQKIKLDGWITQIIEENMPISYVIGWVPFLDGHIFIEPPLLIPRPATEQWCAQLIDHITTKSLANKPASILELCTGTGCIAQALAAAFPHSSLTAVDIDPHAVEIAKKNTASHSNVTILLSDLYTAVEGKTFDLIISNPPYISRAAWESLEPSVKDWENYGALVGGTRGTELIEKIVAQAADYLRNDRLSEHRMGELWIEIGYDQAAAVEALFAAATFTQIKTYKDYEGHDRVVTGTISPQGGAAL